MRSCTQGTKKKRLNTEYFITANARLCSKHASMKRMFQQACSFYKSTPMARNYDGFYDVQDGCQQCKQEHENDFLIRLLLSQIHDREL
jgi:hypothetical protein